MLVCEQFSARACSAGAGACGRGHGGGGSWHGARKIDHLHQIFMVHLPNYTECDSNMPVKSIELELPDDLYMKIGAVASEHFETENEYLQNVISGAIREELELNCLKREIASRYARGEISYESLKTLLGFKEAERIRSYKETISESLLEADEVAKRLKA